MRMEKCVWKIANDTMKMIKSSPYEGKLTWDVSWIKVGRCPIFYIQFQAGQNILEPALRIQKTTDKPWSKNNRLGLYRLTPFFLHNIEEGLSLSTIKQISNAKKPRYN